MKRIIICVFLIIAIISLFGCKRDDYSVTEESSNKNETSYDLIKEYPTENEITTNDEMLKEEEMITFTTYPIEGLTLTDFCRFSYKKDQTLMTNIIEQIGEPSGFTEEGYPFYYFYDGTKITFPVDENGYIYNPYITDSIGRVFTNTTSERDTSTENLITEEDIAAVKNGEYTFEGRNALNDFYGGMDKLLSISNFTVVPFYYDGEKINEDTIIEALGMPSGEGGSGHITSYYQLADGTIIIYFILEGVGVEPDDIGKINHFVINDLAGRSFDRINVDEN